MNPIKTHSKSVKPLKYGGGNDLAIYTYLCDVKYQVQAHFEWNLYRKDMEQDRNENKHFFCAKRMIEKGGRRDIFLGARECQGYVVPCQFGEGEGYYDNYGELSFDLMLHGFDYPDETGTNILQTRFWRPKMMNGVIDFIPPGDCKIKKVVRTMKANPPKSVGLEETGLLNGFQI